MANTGDYHMDVETQRRIEYTRQKLAKIEQMSEQIRKLAKANRNGEEKLDRLMRRKQSLELDVARLAQNCGSNEPEIGTELLNSIEEPMDMDVIYGEAFRKKMGNLKVLLNDIIVRTSFNEKAMCQEIGHQEAEFENKLKEAIQGRQAVEQKTDEAQVRCEQLLAEHAAIYEDVRLMEENIEKFDASRWLINVEKRRVSDILDRTRREPKTGIECRKPYIVPSKASSIEELVHSTASLSHEHFVSEHAFQTANEQKEEKQKKKNNSLMQMVEKKVRRMHKEGCPKKMNPIPYSSSLVSHREKMMEKVEKKACPKHGKMPAVDGINLVDLISKAIQDELDFL